MIILNNKKLNLRNFCIIAHIDHGKSTLADCFLDLTKTIDKNKMKHQYLDNLAIERERGITIKLNFITIKYKLNNLIYDLNLIDTPGHIDFNDEVKRSVKASDGAILVVDGSQGIEAQTITNIKLAQKENLIIIPVINKIDLQSCNVVKTKNQIQKILNLHPESKIIAISAKNKINIESLLKAIVKKIPPPKQILNKAFKAYVFDLSYDNYKGVILAIKVISGVIKINEYIYLNNNEKKYQVKDLGIKTNRNVYLKSLQSGQVGFLSAGIKNFSEIESGCYISSEKFLNVNKNKESKKPMVFCGLYPLDSLSYFNFKKALEKIQLSDHSFTFSKENSKILGHGFRCGFYGLLHSEVIKQRLEKEYNLDLIATNPNVIYQIKLKNNKIITLNNPASFPQLQEIKEIYEPFVKLTLISPKEYIGKLITLCQDYYGIYKGLNIIDDTYQQLTYLISFNEIMVNFFEKVKNISKGYASFNYEFIEFKKSNLTKVDILLNNDKIDALSFITRKEKAYQRSREMCAKLKVVIPRQNFEVAIQAAINRKIIARENVKTWRKDVTAKCYGGDITRKNKLLAKQKKGKKKMKQIGKLNIPKHAFKNILQQ